MAGKVTGADLPTNLADGAVLTETWVDAVYTTLTAYDAVIARQECIFTDNTQYDNSSASTKVEIVNFTIPGGTLGTGNVIEITAHGYAKNTLGPTRSVTFYLKYGSTEISVGSELDTATRWWKMEGELVADGATGAQLLHMRVVMNGAGSGEEWHHEVSNLAVAENSTTDLDLVISIASSDATAGSDWGYYYAYYTLIDFT